MSLFSSSAGESFCGCGLWLVLPCPYITQSTALPTCFALLLPACRFLFLHLHIYFGYLLQFGGPFCCILKLNSIDYQPHATESKPSNKPSISATCRDIVALHTSIYRQERDSLASFQTTEGKYGNTSLGLAIYQPSADPTSTSPSHQHLQLPNRTHSLGNPPPVESRRGVPKILSEPLFQLHSTQVTPTPSLFTMPKRTREPQDAGEKTQPPTRRVREPLPAGLAQQTY